MTSFKLFLTSILCLFLIQMIKGQNETEILTDGIVVPRGDSDVQINPATGKVMYDINKKALMYYDGIAWIAMGSPFERNGTVVSQREGYDTDDFVFGRDSLPKNGEIMNDNFFFFDQSFASFRGGNSSNTSFSPPYTGFGSFAYGLDNQVRGDGSAALGAGNVVNGFYNMSFGILNEVYGGNGSFSLGQENKVFGFNGAGAVGFQNINNGDRSLVIGQFNDTLVTQGQDIIDTSPLFIVGNGDDSNNRSNAFVVRKNGSIVAGIDVPLFIPNPGGVALGQGVMASGTNGAIALGYYSTADGSDTPVAIGSNTSAYGRYGSTAFGSQTTSHGDRGATAMGYRTDTHGDASLVIGQYNDTLVTKGQDVISTSPLFIVGNGDGNTQRSNALVVRKDGGIVGGSSSIDGSSGQAVAIGQSNTASGQDGATAFGAETEASGELGATAMGNLTVASGDEGATAIGLETEASGNTGATAIGNSSVASGNDGATAMGSNALASGNDGAIALGSYTIAAGNSCTAIGQYNDPIVAAGAAVTSTSPLFIVGNGDNTSTRSNALEVFKDGDATLAGNLTENSDRRLKKNIHKINDPTADLNSLSGYYYNWKNRNNDDLQIGLIAQEVQAVFPQLVKEGADGMLSVNYSKFVPILIEAFNAQQKRIKSYERRFENQQDQIDELKSMIQSKL